MKKNKNVFSFLLAFLATSVVFFFYFVVLGAGWFGSFGRLTDGWILAIAVFTVYDLIHRLINEKETITKVYIAMIVLMLMSVFSFTWSTVQVKPAFLLSGVAIAVFLGAVAGLLPRIVSLIKGNRADDSDDGKAFSPEELQKKWTLLRVKLMKTEKKEKKVKLLEENLLFKPVDDDINNALDLERPLIIRQGIAYLVSTAEKDEGLSKEVGNARAYINNLVG